MKRSIICIAAAIIVTGYASPMVFKHKTHNDSALMEKDKTECWDAPKLICR
jgi:hypothetical protein